VLLFVLWLNASSALLQHRKSHQFGGRVRIAGGDEALIIIFSSVFTRKMSQQKCRTLPWTTTGTSSEDHNIFFTARRFNHINVLNKDIYVVESPGCEENVVVFRGGPGGGPGKGRALLLAHLSSEDAGKDYYQSLVTSSNSDPTSKLMTLPVLEQR
jgi:hypothetical protein